MPVEHQPPEPSEPTPHVTTDLSNGGELAPLLHPIHGGMAMGELSDRLDIADRDEWGPCG